MREDIDFNAVDAADAVAELFNVAVNGLSLQEKTKLGQQVLAEVSKILLRDEQTRTLTRPGIDDDINR